MDADIFSLAFDTQISPTANETEPVKNGALRSTAFKAKAAVKMRTALQNSSDEDLIAIDESEKKFSCSLVTSKLTQKSSQELEDQLAKLLKSPAIRAVMKAARSLAADLGVSEQEATQNILTTLKEFDLVWEQILLKEGIEQLCQERS